MTASGGSAALPLTRPRSEALLRGDDGALDAGAARLIRALGESDACLIWHKCGTFHDHLVGVWRILAAWQQEQSTQLTAGGQAVCRLGLFHSAYGNSFVAMRLYDPASARQRGALRDTVGERAERLVWAFCAVDRQALEEAVLSEGRIRPEGYHLPNIRERGQTIRVSPEDARDMILETVADYAEQSTGWQSDMQLGRSGSAPGVAGGVLWPGPMRPTLRLAPMSRFCRALRAMADADADADAPGSAPPLPPIFNDCTAELSAEAEERARDLYWSVVSAEPPAHGEAAETALREATRLNPHVGEPHVVLAQLLLARGAFDEARACAARGAALLECWATAWDKRMPWAAWLNWARAMALQAASRRWPQTHGGMESLGATQPEMLFRELNDARSLLGETA